jgi:hypothetical protein
MSSPWEEHKLAARLVLPAIGQVQESLAVAIERLDEALAIIHAAVGDTEVQTGRDGLFFVAGMRDRIEESMRMAENAKERLRQYGEGI